MIGGFQVGAFQPLPAFQQEGRARRADAGTNRRRRRKLEVEIDGQVFSVESAADAEALIVEARAIAEQQAKVQAEAVIRKRKIASRREKKPLRLDAVQLHTPYVKPVGQDAAELAQRVQAQLDAAYAAAARDAELALRMYYQRVLDEEDALILLLLSE